jgi:uncharacterized membrane protein YdjX (TVP38/TMEM64 family)
VIEARGEPRVSRVIRGFRDRLLAEHLGVAPEMFADACARTKSIHAAVEALERPSRSLRPLSELPESSAVAVSAAAIADLEQPVSLDALVGQFAPEETVRRSLPIWATVVGIVLAVAGLTALWRLTPLAELVTAERVIDWAESFALAWWAPLAIMLAYTPAMVTMFPRPLITLAAVVAFGPWLGFGYAMSGILLAAVLAYWAGSRVSRNTLRRLSGKRLSGLTKALRNRGLLAMTAVRLVPIAPFVVEGLVAGAIRIRPWDYLGGTFLGMLPGVLTATVFGDQLETALRDPSQINYAVIGGVILLFVVGTLMVRRWLSRLEGSA